MACSSLLRSSALTACCLVACHVMPGGYTDGGGGGSSQEPGGASSVSGHGGSGGTAGRGGHVSPTAAGDAGESGAGAGGDIMAATAGESGSSPSAGAENGGAAETMPTEIPADAGAGPVPTNCAAKQATCAVITETACEFASLAGATKTLSCGEVVTAGTIECGTCGLVSVELYFDGRTCWQGAPDCGLQEFAGKFLYPHLP